MAFRSRAGARPGPTSRRASAPPRPTTTRAQRNANRPQLGANQAIRESSSHGHKSEQRHTPTVVDQRRLISKPEQLARNRDKANTPPAPKSARPLEPLDEEPASFPDFLKLPQELRDTIYEHALDDWLEEQDPMEVPRVSPIAQASKQLRLESSEVFARLMWTRFDSYTDKHADTIEATKRACEKLELPCDGSIWTGEDVLEAWQLQRETEVGNAEDAVWSYLWYCHSTSECLTRGSKVRPTMRGT